MPAKLLNMFADENPDLQKQIGCVTGIFQMFDRHHFLTGRHINDHNHKKLLSGQALINSRRHEPEQNSCFSHILQEKNLSKNLNENQRVSMESSLASCSSSSSSSFFSLEYNKSSQQDAFDKTFFSERSSKNSPKFKNPGIDAKYISHDIRRNTPVTDKSTEKVQSHAVKHKDSPRPALLTKARTPADLNESIRVLTKLKEAPSNFSEHEAKDELLYPESRQTSRFSCDGREFSRLSTDSRDDSKSASKLREHRRLSLDGRESSLWSSNFVSKVSVLLEDLDRTNITRSFSKASNLPQDQSSQKRRPSIVAKLMGLDIMPDLKSAATRRSCSPFHEPKDCTSATRPRGTQNEKSNQSPHPVQIGDSITPKQRNHDSLLKLNSRIMTEAAPRTQQDRGRTPRITKTGYQEAQMKQHTESIYRRVEERVKDEDLRALKQTVNAMRAKRLAQAKKNNDQPYKMSPREDYTGQTPSRSNQNSRSPKTRKQAAKEGGTPKALESPIVIMKPAKNANVSDASGHSAVLLEGLSTLPKLHTSSTVNRKKGFANSNTERDHSPRVRLNETRFQPFLPTDKQFIRRATESSSPKLRSSPMQSLSNSKESLGENSKVSTKTSTSLSPRLQQIKIRAEKNSCPPGQSTCRQPVESVSPRGKPKMKQPQARRNKDLVDEIIRETRGLDCRNDEISPCSNKSSSLALQSAVLQQHIHTSRAAHNAALVLNQKNSALNMNQHTSEREFTKIAFEQPSPVPVLDDSCYQDEFPPSPVKETSDTVKNDAPCTSDMCCYTSGLPSKLSDETNTKRLLSSTDEEPPTTDSITLKCDMHNPDHKYVSEILRATGFLNKDLRLGPKCSIPFQLQSSGHAINPDLFCVLEQSKHGCLSKPEPAQGGTQHWKPDMERSQRKLVFDVVNEILAHKVELISNGLLRTKKLGGQHLLEELCSEIERLRAENTGSSSLKDDVNFISGEQVLHRSEWVDFRMEQPRVALEIEELIFEDLIDEVISSATEAGFQAKQSKLRGQPSAN